MRAKRQKKRSQIKNKKRTTASKSDVNKTLQNKSEKERQKGSTEERKSNADLASNLIPTNKLQNDLQLNAHNARRSKRKANCGPQFKAADEAALTIERKERYASVSNSSLKLNENDMKQMTQNTYRSKINWSNFSESRAIELNQDDSTTLPIHQVDREESLNARSNSILINELQNNLNVSAQITYWSKRKGKVVSESKPIEQQQNTCKSTEISVCQMERNDSNDTLSDSTFTNELKNESKQTAPQPKRELPSIMSESRALEQHISNAIAECHMARKESFNTRSNSILTNEQMREGTSIVSESKALEQPQNESYAIAECHMKRKESLDTISYSLITNELENDEKQSAQTAPQAKRECIIKSESRALEQQHNDSNAIAEWHMSRKESLSTISNSFITNEVSAQTTHQSQREGNSTFEPRAVEQQQNDLIENSIPQMERKAYQTNLHKKEGSVCEFLVKIETEYLNLMQHHAKDCSLCSEMIFQTQENQFDVIKSRMKDRDLEIRNLQLNSRVNISNPTLANPYLSSQEPRKETSLNAHRMHESSKVTCEPNKMYANYEKSQIYNKNDPSMVYTQFESTSVCPKYEPTPVLAEHGSTPNHELTPMYKQNNASHVKQIYYPRQFTKYNDSVHYTTGGKLNVTKPQDMYVNNTNSRGNDVQILGVTYPKLIPSKHQNNEGARNQGNLKDISKASQHETSAIVFKKQEARNMLVDHFIDVSFNTLQKTPVNSNILSNERVQATKCQIPAQTTHHSSDQLVNKPLNKRGSYVIPTDTKHTMFNSKPYVYKPVPLRFQIDLANLRTAKNSILSGSQPSGNIPFRAGSYISDYLKLPSHEKAKIPSNADVNSSQDFITLSNLPKPFPLSPPIPITISDIEVSQAASETVKSNFNPLRRSGRKRTMLQRAEESESDFETDGIKNCAHVDAEITDSDSGSSWGHETHFRTKKRSKKIKSFVRSKDPTEVDYYIKGQFKCWLCHVKCTFCSHTKNHIIKKHNEGLGSIDLIMTAETGKVHIVLYCPRSCPYVTYDIDGLKKHIASCDQPLLDVKGIKYLDINNDFVQHIYPELINTEPHLLVGPVKRGRRKL